MFELLTNTNNQKVLPLGLDNYILSLYTSPIEKLFSIFMPSLYINISHKIYHDYSKESKK